MFDSAKELEARKRFDTIHSQDPQTSVNASGETVPRELLEADHLEAWVRKLCPEPSLALRLAARCQHLGRFAVPRTAYEPGRVGYLKWRKDMARRHAELATTILRDLGAPQELLDGVQNIQLKQDLKGNPDGQAMEDALCLSFLEHEFVPFIDRYEDQKIIDIVSKTWRKMSPAARDLALGLPLSGRALTLVQRALTEG
jgi:Domain of unknown function (DUF4202)